MSSQYQITVDLSPVWAAVARELADVTPRLTIALKAIAEKTTAVWQAELDNAHGIWWVEKNRYKESLNTVVTGPMMIQVGTPYTVAEWIESGRPERDLKAALNTSQKVRRFKDGRRFLVIPFRHNTPGHDAHAPSMSPQAYAMAKHLSFSRDVARIQRPVGQTMDVHPKFGMRAAAHQSPYLTDLKTRQAAMTDGHAYVWRDRLSAKMLKAAGFDAHDTRRYAGMVRMQDDAYKNHSGGYMTFRIMAEGQSGWVVPAKPGQWIAKRVSEKMTPIANEILNQIVRPGGG